MGDGEAAALDADQPSPARTVGCNLGFELEERSVLALQIAPSRRAGEVVEEVLDVWAAGAPLVAPVVEVESACGGRVHLVEAPPGPLTIRFSSTVRPTGPPPVPDPAASFPLAPTDGGPGSLGLLDDDVLVALRQSRYCPSDQLGGFANAELGHLVGGDDVAAQVASWVFERLAYVSGSSDAFDTALDTLLGGQGVCRDFAHLTIALCRALGIPARLAAVYAPGLALMDFHAVVEVRRGSGWEVLDATRLAPRSSLVRIATGRDAADTALAATLAGRLEMVSSEVFAVVEGQLPADDHMTPTVLA